MKTTCSSSIFLGVPPIRKLQPPRNGIGVISAKGSGYSLQSAAQSVSRISASIPHAERRFQISSIACYSKLYLFCLILLISFSSCEEKMSEDEIVKIGITQNKVSAPYIQQQGFDATRCALSSSVRKMKGVVLVELPATPNDTPRTWQHPSWDDYGYMGAITTDEKGNAFTAPIPVVNVLDNPFSLINRIYKIDANTADMKLFSTLPIPDSSKPIVPFGVLGVYFDIHSNKLYASSVAGSTRDEENGVIYCIDPLSGKVIEELKGHDAMSLFVGGFTGEKRLYFGSARTSEIFSIELSKNGSFKGDVKTETTLEQLGPRGDDKARRIRFDKNGYMNITGVEFNFSLAANSEVAESHYQFGYNQDEKKWVFMNVK